MPLSRLENFLKNAEGNILYVNPSDFDATDSFENRGNSLTRPFRTIQRALVEAARFSYQVGRNNDKIDNTTILVYPGTHYIDNRPGYSIENSGGNAVFKRYVNFNWITSGATISEFTENSNFDIFDEDNDLYKFNSIEGGVILPRGTSIVGLDLRKTKIRPMYVPDPENDQVDRTAIFRVTGTCYFTAFTLFDADLRKPAYKDSSGTKVTANFSHHKLTCFEYADGANKAILGSTAMDLTDLEMYYYKITHAYGDTSGRGLANYPATTGTDFEPSIDEYRIVGDLRADAIGITSIRAGDGLVPTQTITVKTTVEHGLYKDTPILISGITTNIPSYNGSFLVSDIVDENTFIFTSPVTPTDPLPPLDKIINSKLIVEADSVSSASPYIFSCTLRSVYGMNGLHADGSKATGFKSMLTAQFTGISLQKDDNAFVLYDEETGIYNDTTTAPESEKPLHINSKAVFKPEYENIHMKASNNAIIQCVSIFAIGFAKHFVSESGGDQSITNSNSNFGAISLEASGFRPESFDRDDVGYITHIIPPREPISRTTAVSWLALDATKIVSVAQTSKIWLADYKSSDILPPSQIDSYRIGAKRGEELYLSVIIGNQESTFRSPILMQVPSGIGTSAEKVYEIGRNAGINSITTDIFTFKGNHQLFNGESIRIYSDTGELPANIQSNKVYYAYTSGLNQNQIKISSSLNDANSGNTITGISNGGGVLNVISSVSDKIPGEYGHPIQYDSTEKQWYILGSQATFFNTIYEGIVGIGTSVLGETTGASYVTRKVDNRGLDDRIYKMRYVIPKEFISARPPTDGFILQESKSVGIGSVSFLTTSVEDVTQLRNPRIIVGATYSSGTATYVTELPHNLITGDSIKVTNIVSTANTTGNPSVPYNGSFEVASTPNPKSFTVVGLTTNPGTFLNQTNQRATQQQIEALPIVQREKYSNTVFIYRSQELRKHIPGVDGQDGIYLITGICGSVSPDTNIGFGLSEKRFNQDIKNLYPQQDRDNFNSDPQPTISHAELSPIGKVSTNDRRNSITKEALNLFFTNNRIGYAVTGVTIAGTGNTSFIVYLDQDHNLNQIKTVNLTNPGSGYNNNAGVTTTLFNAELVNSSISGRNASVKASISVGNTITSISIVDGGCAYGVGNTMTISASPAAAPTTSAVVTVTEVSNNIGDSLELSGFVDPLHNGVFKIVEIPSSRSIVVLNPNGIGVTYLGRNDDQFPIVSLVSAGVGVTNINFTKSVGIATISCSSAHGLLPGNTFKLVGTGNTLFSDKLQVSEIVGLNTFTVNAGLTSITQTFNSSGITLHKYGFSANGRALGAGEESLGGRGQIIYAGITTTLSGTITNTTTSINLTSVGGIKKGDFLSISGEIIRVVSDPVGNTIIVNRGQFSTAAVSADQGTLIRKIRVLPMEIRRHSILRASGHTFEYLGYGPGNYSTGLPVKQDRVLSDDEVLISQAREQDGGTVVYTGMNDRGEFYSGATKINGATGEETVIEAPVISFYGDDSDQQIVKRNSGVFDDIVVKERITVEGGENSNQTSQFYGPVNFSQKVTNTSENGLETRDLYIKGVASQPKLLTVGISTPVDPKRSGDISFLANPDPAGYVGHIYADGEWRRWGMISQDKDRDYLKLDQIGIGESTGTYNFRDALEVNGTIKVKNLYVGGAVTFAANQSFSGVTYDDIDITDQARFAGTGSSTFTIKHSNANSIAQFSNILATGYAVTFTTPTIRIENSINSVYSGVSTFAGTLFVNNLRSDAGVLTATSLDGINAGIDTISVRKNAFITRGIVTSFYSEVGTCTNFYSNIGVITSLTGTACTITTINGTSGFLNGLRANSSFTTPNAYVNTGIVTTISGTNLTYDRASVGLQTVTNLRSTDWIGSPTGYINVGIVTTAVIRYLQGDSAASPLEAYINSGVVTSLTGFAATFANIRATNTLVSNSLLTSPVGVVTIMSGTQANYSGIVTCQTLRSTVATGAAPFVVNSITKVNNLNADLLDDLNTSSTDTSGNSVVVRSSGNFSGGTITATQFNGSLQYSLGVSGAPLTITGSTAFNNNASRTIGINATNANTANYVVQRDASGNFSAGTITASFVGNVTGNADSSTQIKTNSIATNANFYITFVNGNNASATNETLYTDAGIYYNPSTNALSVTGDITALISDIRLKTNIQPIENALDKVIRLNGFTYEFNDVAKELGYISEERFAGVSAQEVQEILPEAVKSAPISDEYLTVQYEKLVPLLIESIKELKGEITELRQELDNLKSDK
jgi:hypothetical protein